ncbi:Photosystem I reaction center subunit III [Oscillatoriales cyanobacterium LEGE 11467]|uniref:Photosystem I reaction center subunit III n=1 Tax=Zarconia navalis LEGE 11467 TaxID=1828826 RepID=A0A928Z832_9CYAN|nr:Photosystem I reaction center subunit III [Zarconia navalis]MBE9040119.1 Photosystem I reaction center subunit III [Zarconia navalis LEGE 11467]
MRKILAFVLAGILWFSFAPTASAEVAGLTPCNESPAFIARAKAATTEQAKNRFELYGQELLCGPEGLPHLIVDGRWSHAGEFLIPSILFLYITGWIGWVGRAYIQAIKNEKSPEDKEIIIDVPLAVKQSLTGFAWPLAAFKEMTTGEMFAKEEEITVSPR